MMRYAFVAIIIVVFLLFFGPSMMAWGRNMARQLKTGWREQEQDQDEMEHQVDGLIKDPVKIDSDEEYREVMSEINELAKYDPPAESLSGKRLQYLSEIVEAYEKEQ